MMSLRKLHRTVDGREEKHCGNCDQWLLLREFHREKGQVDELQAWCKKCNIEYHLKRYHDIKEGTRVVTRTSSKLVEHRFAEDGTELKYCSRCDSWKLLGEFGRSGISSDRLYGRCKKCNCENSLKYSREVLGTKPKHYLRPQRTVDGHKEKFCPRCKQYLSLDKFGLNNAVRDKLSSRCKKCTRGYYHKRKRISSVEDLLEWCNKLAARSDDSYELNRFLEQIEREDYECYEVLMEGLGLVETCGSTKIN